VKRREEGIVGILGIEAGARVGLSRDASAAQHLARTLYEMLPRGAGDVGARIHIRLVPAVGERPAVSEIPAAASRRVRGFQFEGVRKLINVLPWQSLPRLPMKRGSVQRTSRRLPLQSVARRGIDETTMAPTRRSQSSE